MIHGLNFPLLKWDNAHQRVVDRVPDQADHDGRRDHAELGDGQLHGVLDVSEQIHAHQRVGGVPPRRADAVAPFCSLI